MLRAAHHVYRKFSTKSTYTGAAFVFDIDGVLIRGKKVIPSAPTAMQSLYDFSSQMWKAPVIFLTNGGGVTEVTRAERLSNMLKVPVGAEQIVLSHSPMKQMASKYDSTGSIVTVGNPQCAAIARAYGFTNVIGTETLAALNPPVAPFARVDHVTPTKDDYRVAELPVSAIFVMTDSRDWGRDIQIILDILQSDGTPTQNPAQNQQVDLYFSNPDILFPNEHPLPRLAGGSFRVALDAVYERVTRRKLRAVQFGKPHEPNYHLAESMLTAQVAALGFCERAGPTSIYAIGDNPLTDVRGANARGDKWVSVLVRTGNFSGENDSVDPAKLVVDNVGEAVLHASMSKGLAY